MDKGNRLGTSKIVKHLHKLFFLFILGALLPGSSWASDGEQTPGWLSALQDRLAEIDAAYPGELGVYVKDMHSGLSYSLRGEESWYLASGVKVPVAIAVMRGIERGEFSLNTRLRLQPGDFVDGAGQTNWHPPGAELSIAFLMDQMLIYSDNTATDVLIRLVGLETVNAVARELMPGEFGKITTLADVRRHAYSAFHASAFRLSGPDFFALRQMRDERKRIELLASILEVAENELAESDISRAFDTYYATHLNAAPLSAFAALLEALAEGRALQPHSTEYLMGVLQRVKTGERRIKAGLSQSASFAHKTGTQHRRACDLGVASVAHGTGDRRVVIAACSRGAVPVARAEQALREIGAAVEASGLLSMPFVAEEST
jgi:beta-lactamase class A